MTQEFQYPFPSPPDHDPPCDEGGCNPSASCPSSSEICGGGSLVNTSGSCTSCEDLNNQEEYKFLGCSILGFSGKLGYNGSESSVTIDLATTSDSMDCDLDNCWDPAVSCSPAPSPGIPYEGSIGNIYTFTLGSFCFRGILSDHQYSESDNGFRYKVTLNDGRKVLSNVAVILNDLYTRVPDELYPNVINALYDSEQSVGDNVCGSAKRCKDFGKSGGGNKGMFLKKVMEAINDHPCQVPVSKACLNINVDKIIDITPPATRVSTSESNVLDLITLACEEAGYDFYIEIVGNEIVAKPINNKNTTATNYDESAPLFQYINNLDQNYVVIDREYGQEMTFNRSKKLVFGDSIKYMTVIEPSASPCYYNDPGSIGARNPLDADKVFWPSCDPLPS